MQSRIVAEALDDVLKGIGPPPIDWLVHGFMPRGTVLMWASDYGVGKSLLAYDLAIAIATGQPFLGFPCVQGPVLYFDEENARSFAHERVYKLGQGREVKQLDGIFLLHLQQMMARTVRDWSRDMAEATERVRPALVVIDTLSSFYGGPGLGKENDASMMKGLLAVLRASSLKYGGTLLILHHIPKDPMQRRSPRGSGAIGGDVDGYWSLAHERGRPNKSGFRTTTLRPEKVRVLDGVPEMKISVEKLGKVGVKIHAEPKL